MNSQSTLSLGSCDSVTVSIFPIARKTTLNVPKVEIKNPFKRETTFLKQKLHPIVIDDEQDSEYVVDEDQDSEDEFETRINNLNDFDFKVEISRLLRRGLEKLPETHVEPRSSGTSTPEPEVIDHTGDEIVAEQPAPALPLVFEDRFVPDVDEFDGSGEEDEEDCPMLFVFHDYDYEAFVVSVYFKGTRQYKAGTYPFLIADVVPGTTKVRGFPFEWIGRKNSFCPSTRLIEIDADCITLYREDNEHEFLDNTFPGLVVFNEDGTFTHEADSNLMEWLHSTGQEDFYNPALSWNEVLELLV